MPCRWDSTLIADLRAHPPELTTWVPKPDGYTFIRNHTDPSARLMLLNTESMGSSSIETTSRTASSKHRSSMRDCRGGRPRRADAVSFSVSGSRTSWSIAQRMCPSPQAPWNYLADPTRGGGAVYVAVTARGHCINSKVPRRG